MIRNDVLPVLSNPVSAECSSNNISCSFSYSADSAHTPRLNRINVSRSHISHTILGYAYIVQLLIIFSTVHV